jgi:uncharacterized RmlC-like cupin family protein
MSTNGNRYGPGGPEPAPPPDDIDAFHRRLHRVAQAALDPETAQTPGMRRLAAISARTVGSSKLWMGQTHVAPSTASGNHHHGASETAIYVVSGNPEFVFPDDEDVPGAAARGDLPPPQEVRIRTSPGDFIFVPPWVPHREENPDRDREAVVVIARSTQEAIVVNLPELRWAGPVRTTGEDVSGCS